MEQALTLLQLNRNIKSLLQNHLGGYHWVIAEIGTLQIARQGHCYLEMVEQENGQMLAKNRATIWSGQYASIATEFSAATGESLKQGISVLFCCTVNFHEVYGLSLNIVKIDPSYTLGERAKKRAETIKKLQDEGVIDLNKSVLFPMVLQKVAVISSPTAAGYDDFTNQLQNNQFGYSIYSELFPASMQGSHAADSIISALNEVRMRKEEFDLVTIIRGGGSQLDLDCFDSYDLAYAIAHTPLAVITGIGHQRDDTVADTVARLKLKTPTAVADHILQSMEDFETGILECYQDISQLANQQLNLSREKISNLRIQLYHQSQSRMKEEIGKLEMYQLKLHNSLKNKIQKERHEIRITTDKLASNNPEKILNKGYSITLVDGKPLNQLEIKEGMNMETRTNTRSIYSRITKFNKIESNNE